MTATLVREAAITLEVSVCDQRFGYNVTFEGPNAEVMALAFMDRKTAEDKAAGYTYGNHAFHEIEDAPVGPEYGALQDRLYPQCGHGLSLDLCAGPGHYFDH